jgi:hypothetical protein
MERNEMASRSNDQGLIRSSVQTASIALRFQYRRSEVPAPQAVNSIRNFRSIKRY